MRKHLSPLRILAELGITVSMDWDDSIAFEYPTEPISTARLAEIVEDYRYELEMCFRNVAQRRLQQFVGGPLSGKPCEWRPHGSHYGYRLKRAWWAVYRWERDGRARFVGHATSQAKARRAEIVST